MNALAAEILARARAQGWTLALAESCTGGRVAAALTGPAGASDVFTLGLVTYSNAAKTALLGVKPATLEAFGAVSEEVAREMAEGARAASGADVTLAVTGIAGPGPSAHKPEGRVCFALCRPGAATFSETQDFGALGRTGVQTAATAHALRLLHAATGG